MARVTASLGDLGVPAARSARTFAVTAAVLTALVGLFVWDLVGILVGLPFAIIGLVRGARAWRATAAYPRDRRALVVALTSIVLWAALSAFIGARADRPGPATDTEPTSLARWAPLPATR